MNMNMKADDELSKVMQFFNTRQDALTAMVKSRSDVKGHLGDLHILQITDDDIEFAYHPPPTEERKTLTIKFEPPLINAWGALPRLKTWRDSAYKKWDVPLRPKVYYFKRPGAFPFAAPAIIALAVLAFATFGEGYYLANVIRAFTAKHLGVAFLKYAGYLAALLHLIVEPIFMIALCYRYSTPIVPAIQWVLCNVVIGYGALNEFRECVMYERMRVIYRNTDVGDTGPYVKGSIDATKKSQ